MAYDPWLKTTLPLKALGAELRLKIPHDVFSTAQIDEGTRLLLDHLPKNTPQRVLDMGCGYGALGLPIAAKYKNATIDMVDRDLLAVRYSATNAAENNLENVNAFGSLGYRDVSEQNYDWILCNIPARIGTPFIEDFFISGQGKLSSNGVLSVVVIRDLAALLEEIAKKLDLPLIETARGQRHVVYSLNKTHSQTSAPDFEALYLRDQVTVAGLTLDRPFDLGGDDPKRLQSGLPVLFDVMPKSAPKRVLCFRCGYGQVPSFVQTRFKNAEMIATDRDLLATAFTRRNVSGIKVIEAVDLKEITGSFDLIVGELSPSAGLKVAQSELIAIREQLASGGQALLLGLSKMEKEWFPEITRATRIGVRTIISRDSYSVYLIK